MDPDKLLRIYLDDDMRESAEAGQHNFMNRIKSAFEGKGFSVVLCRNSAQNRLKSATQGGYSLFHMDHPFHARALTMRRAYFYPFWRIENSAKRWEWDVARAQFSPRTDEQEAAARFAKFWKKRLFNDGPDRTLRDGFVYIPLQGRLLEHRSFQACSPVEMIKSVLAHDPQRRIVVTLHPNEDYSDEERSAVQALSECSPQIMIAKGQMNELLRTCDYIVTQNSSVALSGFFHHKPAVLFGKIDFHHIAANVGRLGQDEAFRAVKEMQPDFDAYLFWFLKRMSINAGNEDAEQQILDTVNARGWSV